MLPPNCDVKIKHSQRFHISQCRHFQRLYRPSCPLAKVRGCTSPVEERAVERGVARLRVLLRGSAQQRPPHPHFQPIKRLVDRGVTGGILSIKIESVTYFSHVLQPIRRFAVAVVAFDPKTVENDVNPAGEPAAGGLARVLSQRLFD
jgi:hypothetical protein